MLNSLAFLVLIDYRILQYNTYTDVYTVCSVMCAFMLMTHYQCCPYIVIIPKLQLMSVCVGPGHTGVATHQVKYLNVICEW